MLIDQNLVYPPPPPTNYSCFPLTTAKQFSTSCRNIPMKFMMILFLHWTGQVFCNSLGLQSPVSKGHTNLYMFFNWMRILEYFHSMGRFNTKKMSSGKQPTSPSCVWTAIHFLLRHLCFIQSVSSSTQFPCSYSYSLHLCTDVQLQWNQMHL